MIFFIARLAHYNFKLLQYLFVQSGRFIFAGRITLAIAKPSC